MNCKILRLPEVMETCALSRSSIYSFIKTGEFPPPIQLGQRAVGWPEIEIMDWLNRKISSPRRLIKTREALHE
jgi:prophage regulatory protein